MGMILAGQKDAKKRVFLFFTIYVTTGLMSKSRLTVSCGVLIILTVFSHSTVLWSCKHCCIQFYSIVDPYEEFLQR